MKRTRAKQAAAKHTTKDASKGQASPSGKAKVHAEPDKKKKADAQPIASDNADTVPSNSVDESSGVQWLVTKLRSRIDTVEGSIDKITIASQFFHSREMIMFNKDYFLLQWLLQTMVHSEKRNADDEVLSCQKKLISDLQNFLLLELYSRICFAAVLDPLARYRFRTNTFQASICSIPKPERFPSASSFRYFLLSIT